MAQELNVVDVYNDLHQIPELGFQEFKTSAYIAEKLKQMGYEVTTGVGKTGVVAVEKGVNCPFEVQRAFYIFGTKDKARRGCHANRKSQFLFIALKGSCRVEFSDGNAEESVLLDSPTKALWLDKMIWKEMFDFSEDAVLLVLSSEKYDAEEYIRSREEFLKAKEAKK